jgi:hypothetical protein
MADYPAEKLTESPVVRADLPPPPPAVETEAGGETLVITVPVGDIGEL